jgi:hypothetical protein
MRVVIVIWLGLALSILLASGCSSSNLASASKASASIAEGRAVTYAQAVNLRAGDVPGLVAVGGSRVGERQPLEALVRGCDVATVPTGIVVAVGSPAFQREQKSTGGTTSYLPLEAVSSGVDVMRSAALASREVAAIEAVASSSAVTRCLKRHLMQERARVVSEGAATGVPAGKPLLSHVEISALRSPVQGIPAFELRISADFTIKVPGTKGRSRYYEDFLGFAVGPAVIILGDTSSPRPFPATTERRLLSLLHSRAEANSV